MSSMIGRDVNDMFYSIKTNQLVQNVRKTLVFVTCRKYVLFPQFGGFNILAVKVGRLERLRKTKLFH